MIEQSTFEDHLLQEKKEKINNVLRFIGATDPKQNGVTIWWKGDGFRLERNPGESEWLLDSAPRLGWENSPFYGLPASCETTKKLSHEEFLAYADVCVRQHHIQYEVTVRSDKEFADELRKRYGASRWHAREARVKLCSTYELAKIRFCELEKALSSRCAAGLPLVSAGDDFDIVPASRWLLEFFDTDLDNMSFRYSVESRLFLEQSYLDEYTMKCGKKAGRVALLRWWDKQSSLRYKNPDFYLNEVAPLEYSRMQQRFGSDVLQ